MKMSINPGTMYLLAIAALLLSPCVAVLAAAVADESEPECGQGGGSYDPRAANAKENQRGFQGHGH